jgi:hypothetical protein
MTRIDGTAARQLELIDDLDVPRSSDRPERFRRGMRLLRRDIYAELERRRRRAQIAARHLIEKP